MEEVSKRGRLEENYRLFHISDRRDADFETHSHDFHKIIICMTGSVTYIMEGKTYLLHSKDLLFVPKGKIHKSHISSKERYERVVFWIKDEYVRSFEEDGNSLATCFDMALVSNICAVGLDSDTYYRIMSLLTSIESREDANLFGRELLKNSYFQQLMVILNRLSFAQKPTANAYISDPKFDEILTYINENLSEELSVDSIAEHFYMSGSYLMHRFRELTGCSVHNYINQKRLTEALELIKRGSPASVAASESGFSDYTAFYRNFRRMFGVTPSQIMKK